MEYALKKFKSRIDFIERQIHTQGVAHEIIKSRVGVEHQEDEMAKLKEVLSNTTDEKVYQYTANVISLYGGLECFVEDVAQEYLKEISVLWPSYKQMLAVAGMNEYLQHGIGLINHAEERKFKSLPKTDVLKSLYDTIVKDKSGSVKSEAYIDAGGGNYKHKTIMKCFLHLGIKKINDELKNFTPLSDYIENNGVDNSDLAVYAKVDDLVERRNELAHGSDNIETLDSLVFKEYLTFLSLYAETINNYLENEIKSHKWSESKREEVTPRVFSDNIISLGQDTIGIGTEFHKGQKLYIARSRKYYEGEIANIRVDESDHEVYKKENAGVVIGLKIASDCLITKDCKFKFL